MMKMIGRAWVFEGVLDVDWEICPLQIMRQLRERLALGEMSREGLYKEYGKYCLTKVDPEFPTKVRKGDFIVSGEGMGYGHDHDHACMSVRGAGVGAVLCNASGAYFKRNSIHHGLPVVEVKGILAATKQGDELEVDLAAGAVANLNSGRILHFSPYPDFLIEIIQAGGIYPLLKSKIAAGHL